MADAYEGQGKNTQAEALYREIIGIQRCAHGPDALETLFSLKGLSLVLAMIYTLSKVMRKENQYPISCILSALSSACPLARLVRRGVRKLSRCNGARQGWQVGSPN